MESCTAQAISVPITENCVIKSVKEPSMSKAIESVIVLSNTVLRVGDIVSLRAVVNVMGSVRFTTNAIT